MSAAAVFDIARHACLAMERTAPSSLDDGTDLARELKANFDAAEARCLEAADWSFASRLAHLPARDLADGEAADAELPYLYNLPADLVRLHEVGSLSDKWRRDAEGIRSDCAAPLRIRYTARLADQSAYPAEFRAAVAMTLALILAPTWLQTASKIDAIEARAARAIKQAMRNHARDASPARYDGGPEEGDWASEARW